MSPYLIKWKGEKRCWVVLQVTEKDVKRGINADVPGRYAFAGMWYGRNPAKIRSYGKIRSLDKRGWHTVRNDLHCMKVNEIKELVD